MNFLPLTEPNPINNLGWVKVSQQTDAENCDRCRRRQLQCF